MDSILPAAVVQLNSTLNKEANLDCAVRLTKEAARQGAHVIVLPELFNCLGPLASVVAEAESIPGPTTDRMSGLARELGVVLCAGTICERSGSPTQGFNTCLLFDTDGTLAATYRKIHLFDAEIPDQARIAESAHILPGEQVVVATTSAGRVGLATCYDVRFPELFRRLVESGAEIICLPSAFTKVTGAAHWTTLVCARAIENQCFMLAANQVGYHSAEMVSFGHSLIVDPWGSVLAEATSGESKVICATLTQDRLLTVRQQLPALCHRRAFLC